MGTAGLADEPAVDIRGARRRDRGASVAVSRGISLELFLRMTQELVYVSKKKKCCQSTKGFCHKNCIYAFVVVRLTTGLVIPPWQRKDIRPLHKRLGRIRRIGLHVEAKIKTQFTI